MEGKETEHSFLFIFLGKTFSFKIFCQLLNLELDVKDCPEVTQKITCFFSNSRPDNKIVVKDDKILSYLSSINFY